MAIEDEKALLENYIRILSGNISKRGKFFFENYRKSLYAENLLRIKFLAEDVQALKENYIQYFNLKKPKKTK